MVACHTGIYAGLMGRNMAPNTREAYYSDSFWDFLIPKWGNSVPKSVLKTLIYSGLNGASLRGDVNMRSKIENLVGKQTGSNTEECLLAIVSHPIIQELTFFQTTLGQREKGKDLLAYPDRSLL